MNKEFQMWAGRSAEPTTALAYHPHFSGAVDVRGLLSPRFLGSFLVPSCSSCQIKLKTYDLGTVIRINKDVLPTEIMTVQPESPSLARWITLLCLRIHLLHPNLLIIPHQRLHLPSHRLVPCIHMRNQIRRTLLRSIITIESILLAPRITGTVPSTPPPLPPILPCPFLSSLAKLLTSLSTHQFPSIGSLYDQGTHVGPIVS